ncbi:MAG: hypothetical protein JWN97_3397, partial [Nocardioides sp.]|nr:hypothetical protein [Nocardioides sp.]
MTLIPTTLIPTTVIRTEKGAH